MDKVIKDLENEICEQKKALKEAEDFIKYLSNLMLEKRGLNNGI